MIFLLGVCYWNRVNSSGTLAGGPQQVVPGRPASAAFVPPVCSPVTPTILCTPPTHLHHRYASCLTKKKTCGSFKLPASIDRQFVMESVIAKVLLPEPLSISARLILSYR
ncbi:hypothetical protein J6590_034555 [Homalodisca vitripennis]|nr:hypothetical protein J6590_034555 [Homalodisca vitripennis]